MIKEGTVRVTDVGDGKYYPDHNLGTYIYVYISVLTCFNMSVYICTHLCIHIYIYV
jgi:hypothetical protein